MRLLVLELRLLSRTAGLAPAVVFALWVAVCLVEEPSFFRAQGIDLLWKAADSTILLLGFCLVSIATEVRRPRVEVWANIIAQWLGLFLLIIGGALFVLVAEWCFAGRADLPWLTRLATHCMTVLLPLPPAAVLLARAGIPSLYRHVILGTLLAVSLGAQGFSHEATAAWSANLVTSALLTVSALFFGSVLGHTGMASTRRSHAHRDPR